MSDTENNDKRTPLEKTLNLPSIEELNENFSNEAIENSSGPEDDELYIEDLEDFGWDEKDMDLDPETLKAQIVETQRKIAQLKDSARHERHLKSYHRDVDSIHQKAMEKFEEIMSVALTMEANAGSKYLASATKLLDIALSAKNSAMDRELEMAKLQLRKEKQDHDMYRKDPKDIDASTSEGVDESEVDQGGTFDRNSLVESFIVSDTEDSSDKD